VTDDLLATQNPAETDSTLRRDHIAAGSHSIFPAVAAEPLPTVLSFSQAFRHLPRSAISPPRSSTILLWLPSRTAPTAA